MLRCCRTPGATRSLYSRLTGGLAEVAARCPRVALTPHAGPRTEHSGRSKGMGILEYGTREEAEEAIRTLNETELDGRQIAVREDRDAPAREGGGGDGSDRGGRGRGRGGRSDGGGDRGDRGGRGGGGRGRGGREREPKKVRLQCRTLCYVDCALNERLCTPRMRTPWMPRWPRTWRPVTRLRKQRSERQPAGQARLMQPCDGQRCVLDALKSRHVGKSPEARWQPPGTRKSA